MPIRTRFPDLARIVVVLREPQRACPAKIEPVKRTIDPERLGEPSWSSRQVTQALGSTIALHDRDALERLERPDQDAGATPFVSLETFSIQEIP